MPHNVVCRSVNNALNAVNNLKVTPQVNVAVPPRYFAKDATTQSEKKADRSCTQRKNLDVKRHSGTVTHLLMLRCTEEAEGPLSEQN